MCADILRNVSVYPFCATERTSLIIPQMSSVCQQQRKLIKTGVNLNFDYIKKVEWDYTLQTISRDASNDSYEITDGKGIILSANGNMYYNKPVVVMDKANNVLATIRKENSFLQIKYRIDLEGSTYIVEKALFCGNNTLFNIHLLNTKEIMYSISGNILSRKYKSNYLLFPFNLR